MLKILVKALIFIAMIQCLNFVIALKVGAATDPKEIYLKQLSDHVFKALRHSNEAQTYLREDLEASHAVLGKASIKWTNSLSSVPLLFDNDGIYQILLSDSFSFQGSPEQRVATIIGILFKLKRQLEGSTLPVPELRITLFARKFAPILFGEQSSCKLSLYPLPKTLQTSQRKELLTKLLSLVQAQGFSYHSDWGQHVLWIDINKKTDGECWGNNRNIATLNTTMLDLVSLETINLGKITQTSCGHDPINWDRALKKLIKRIKSNLPKCNSAF